ncbi:MAG: AAA family ATPase [Candidatus Thermoplasmatota archaeon]|nr:AAA family ATPase [Candidatus Thermoplasmatota archaeon]MBS3801393.1 AAA family ATPase [Candidatus Thermoplasmatota archaeon]
MVRITLSGTPGSGKSTIAELLHERLSLPYVYSGMIFRELAKEHNMSLADFGSYCETHDDIDRELDEKQVTILKKGNVILEGRLAGWLAVLNNITAFKIWIDAKPSIRAERIVEREGGNIKKQHEKLLNRQKSEQIRYKTYYDIDIMDTSIYDLCVDSSNKKPQEILQISLDKLKTAQKSH